MTFLEAVNRILRLSAIIRGDTDTVSTFNDTQHNASLNLAIVATQNELVRLIAERLIPKERSTSGSITLSTNTRTYDLATGFTRFYGVPHFYNSTHNRQIYEYPGGLEKLQVEIFNYQTQYGQPNWWYWEPVNSTLKKVGFFLVPSSAENGEVWTYDYETSVMVTASSDNMPFHNDEENFVFVEMCGRRFKFMFEDNKNTADIQQILDNDTSYRSAKSTLLKLLSGQNPSSRYGAIYR
jgi:hypothetical protein